MLRTGSERPERCFQCGRCTSACTIAKIVKEYRPNRLVGYVRHGLTEKAHGHSIWTCARCLKCVESCPQKVAPADVILSLQYIASSGGSASPDAYRAMLNSLSESGLAFREMEVTDRDFEAHDRASMGLPPLPTWSKHKKASEIISRVERGEV